MANNSTLEALKAAVTQAVEVEKAATELVNGIAGRVQAAVDKAIAGGASAEDLAPITDEIEAINAASAELSAAVAANTVAAPTPDQVPAKSESGE